MTVRDEDLEPAPRRTEAGQRSWTPVVAGLYACLTTWMLVRPEGLRGILGAVLTLVAVGLVWSPQLRVVGLILFVTGTLAELVAGERGLGGASHAALLVSWSVFLVSVTGDAMSASVEGRRSALLPRLRTAAPLLLLVLPLSAKAFEREVLARSILGLGVFGCFLVRTGQGKLPKRDKMRVSSASWGHRFVLGLLLVATVATAAAARAFAQAEDVMAIAWALIAAVMFVVAWSASRGRRRSSR